MSPLRLNGTTSGYTELSAPATAGSNTLTLPTGNGTNGQYLQTNGSGVLSWGSVTSSQWTTSGSNIYYTTGNVGIGVSSPSYPLHVASGTARLGFTNTGALPRLWFGDSNGNAENTYIHAYGFYFETGGTTPGTGTERMRLDSGGRLLINTTSPVYDGRLCVEENAASVRNVIAANNTAPGTSSTGFIAFYRNSTYTGGISNTNNTTAYNTSSDYRLKENIVPLTGAADRLKQIPVHRFNFITDPDRTVDGFIAHEAQAIVPECVTGEKDAVDKDGNPVYQGIDQSKLVPLLTAALQEALTEIENIKASNAALETRIAALEVTP